MIGVRRMAVAAAVALALLLALASSASASVSASASPSALANRARLAALAAQLDAPWPAVDDAALMESYSLAAPAAAAAATAPAAAARNISASAYWRDANHRRAWCDSVRGGYGWIERHPHWQRVCRRIERFRPFGWWSEMCHRIAAGSDAAVLKYATDPKWQANCKKIANPFFRAGPKRWQWNPRFPRHEQAGWCEANGHKYRDLTDATYNYWCDGREMPRGWKRGLWTLSPDASKSDADDFFHCKQFRSASDSWKQNNKEKTYVARCTKGEGARGAKHPGFQPELTAEQIASVKAEAKRAGAAAKEAALKPKWRWSKKVPRTAHSDWCEQNGLTQSDSAQFAKQCEGNRESDEEAKQRAARAEKRAEKAVLRRIPVKLPPRPKSNKNKAAKSPADKKAAKADKPKFSDNAEVLKARRKAAYLRAKAGVSKERAAKAKLALQKAEQELKAALPKTIKDEQRKRLMHAIEMAATLPLKHKKRKGAKAAKAAKKACPAGEAGKKCREEQEKQKKDKADKKKKVMPPAPAMPALPANADQQLAELSSLARKRSSHAPSRSAAKSSADIKAEAKAEAKAAIERMARESKAKEKRREAHKARKAARSSKKYANAAGAGNAMSAAAPAPAPAPAANPALQPQASTPASVLPPVDPFAAAAGAALAAREAAAEQAGQAPKPSKLEELKARWAAEDKKHAEERRKRIEAEERQVQREEAQQAQRRRRQAAQGRLDKLKADELKRAAAAGKRVVTPAESIDWNKKYPSPSLDSWKHIRRAERKAKHEATYAKEGEGGCPTCRRPTKKNKWPIVLDPTSVSGIDLPLVQELHRRVDYLLDSPSMSIRQDDLERGRQIVVDAGEQHQRVYDFQDKHKGEKLIPDYMKEERQIHQLE